jgi:NAD(P)-dependent dehydrogenase (short-subunit alcohol dehydrogenase family)
MLATRGGKVTVLDRGDAETGEPLAEDLGGLVVPADVTLEEEVTTVLDAETEAHGAPRIVVNCAGMGTIGRVSGRDTVLPLEAFQRTINVNLVGTFNAMRLAAARTADLESLTDGERRIDVNTASVAAFGGQIGQAAHASSKGGIVAMSLPVAREFARIGVRVNVVGPGIFLSPLLYNLSAEAQKSLAADVPLSVPDGRSRGIR